MNAENVFAAIREPFRGRILARISVLRGCWLFSKPDPSTGYARITVKGRRVYVHRLAYMLVHGAFAPSLQIDHLCHQRNCVNPRHMEAVPQRVNILRGVGFAAENARKTHCPQGHEYALHARKKKNARDCGICHRVREYERKHGAART